MGSTLKGKNLTHIDKGRNMKVAELFPLNMYLYNSSKIPLLRPFKIKTASLLRPVFASPKLYCPYDIIFDSKITSLIRSRLSNPKGGLNSGVVLYS